jgi:NAD+ synthase
MKNIFLFHSTWLNSLPPRFLLLDARERLINCRCKEDDMGMNAILGKNYDKIISKIEKFIAERVKDAGMGGGVIGLSGGLDSTVVAFLAAQALGAERLLGMVMPDSRVTPSSDVEDAQLVVKMLNIEHCYIDIASIHSAYCKNLPRDKMAEGNLSARIRMSILYYFANLKNRLVIGTGDQSEILVGYFTKYGDGGADILPLGRLYKSQVVALGRVLGIPQTILDKKSSPRLWPGQEAEVELGLSYSTIDQILHSLFEKKIPRNEAIEQYGLKEVKRVTDLHEKSKHKRGTPPMP